VSKDESRGGGLSPPNSADCAVVGAAVYPRPQGLESISFQFDLNGRFSGQRLD
jgi:hypothetical protein